ncbi:MAG: TetR/AcrR family transcriptional regulator [Chloroflexi bacterium]|nr:TetR/AcrR family transcriptional regulator [Chloroflexota bacterium]
MKSNKNDRRSQRTRQLLTNALVELMLEKSYESITVQDIIDRANVGRSTFYAHYLDKEDLLTSQFEEAGRHLGEEFSDGDSALFLTLRVFQHTRENYRLYKALVWGRGIEIVFKALEAHLNAHLEAEFKQKLGERPSPIPLPVVTHYITGAFLTLLKWWLDNNMPVTPEDMDRYFRQLTIPSVEGLLDIKFK